MSVSDPAPPADPWPASPHEPDESDIRRSGVVLLLIAFLIAVGFVVFRDRLPYPLQPPPGPAAIAGVTPRTASPPPLTAAPTSSPVASATPGLTPSPPAPSPEPTVAPTPRPTPRPTATPRPTQVSDRYALLRPCPGTSGCWIYRVRSGDNLYSIANWFGVPLARVYDMNPWLRTTGLRAGQELRLPRPTR